MSEIIMIVVAIFVIYIIFKFFKKSEPSIDYSSLSEKEKTDLVLDFDKKMKNQLHFRGEDFCKFYKIDLDNKRRELKNNPGLLVTMGVGNMFGGSIGAIYSTIGVFSTVLRAGETSSLTGALMDIYFDREWSSLSSDDKKDLKLIKLLQVEGIFTNDDFKKAFYSIVWNDGNCKFSNVGKKSDGAFGGIELNDWQKAAVVLMSNLVASSVLSLEKTKQVIANNSSKLSPESLESIELSK